MVSKDNIITMHYHSERTVRFLSPAYEFKPHGRLHWLQCWMWRMLFKMKALEAYFDQREEYKKITIDRGSVAKNLLEAYSKSFPRNKPRQVYMGHKQFEELSGNHLDHYLVGFSFAAPMSIDGKAFDLPITVLSNMDGVLIV